MADLGSMISQMTQQPDSGQQIASTLQGLSQQMQQRQAAEQEQQMAERQLSMQEDKAAVMNEQRRKQIEQMSQEMDLTDLKMEQQGQEMVAQHAQGLLNFFDEQGNLSNPVAYEKAYQEAIKDLEESGIDLTGVPEEAPSDPAVLKQARDAATDVTQQLQFAQDKKLIEKRGEEQRETARTRHYLTMEELRAKAGQEARSEKAEGVGNVTPATGREISAIINRLKDEGIDLDETQRDIFAQDVADRARKLNEATDLGTDEARDLVYNYMKGQRIQEGEAGSWYNPLSWMGTDQEVSSDTGGDVVGLFQRAKQRYPNKSDSDIASALRTRLGNGE